jgi:hypothetical protein
MDRLNKFVILALVLFVVATLAFAQGVTSSITGLIGDATHAVVPDALIVATEIGTGVQSTARSSSAGYYRIPVPPGTYRIEVVAEGFDKAVIERIAVGTAQTVTGDFTLQVASTRSAVTVVADIPLLTTASAEVSGAVTPQEFQALPIIVSDGGRDAQSFIYSTLAGANPAGSINGGQPSSQAVLIDGVTIGRYDANDALVEFAPSTDAIGEFSEQMSNYSAEYGGTGGGISNFTMKSGANQFHGSAYEYNRNPFFAANGVINNTFGRNKGNLRDNDFGATLGGPIRREKTFFFFSYEGDRYRNLNPGPLTTLPTIAMRKGDFSSVLGGQVGTDALGRPVYLNEIYNPLTTRNVPAGTVDPVSGLKNSTSGNAVIRDPFMYNGKLNVVDPNYFSTSTSVLLPKWPNPMNDANFNNAVSMAGGQAQLTRNAFSIKLDHVINDAHRLTLFVNYNWRDRFLRSGTSTLPYDPLNPLSNFKEQFTGGPMARLSHAWTVNSHSVNQLTIAFNRFVNDNGNQTGATDLGKQMNLSNVDQRCLASATFRNSGGRTAPVSFVPSCRTFDPSQSYSLQDTYSTVKGRHSLKFGGQWTHYRYNTFDNYSTGGAFTFRANETMLQGFNNQTGQPFASFLLGAVDSGYTGVFPETFGYRQGLASLFAQDDFKVTPRLTLNVGIRWEIPVPKTEQYDRMSGFDATLPNAAADGYPGALAFIGNCATCSKRNSFEDWYFKNIGPRIGLAYQINQKMVFRGGYGIVYEPPIQWSSGMQSASGFNSTIAMNANTSPTGFKYDPVLYWSPLAGASVPATARVGPLPLEGTLPNYSSTQMNGNFPDFLPSDALRLPYIQNWSAGLQFQLRGQIVIETNYVGSKGTRLGNSFAGFSGYVDQTPSKYMPLGDILMMDMAEALADPVASKALAAYGITKLPYPSFEENNWNTNVATALSPYPQFTGLQNLAPFFGSSTYHSAQMTVRKQSSHGLTFIASYTFSKNISDTDGAMYSPGGVQSYTERRLEKSVTSYDQSHVLKLSWVYSLPFGHGKKWLANTGSFDRLFAGWQLAAIQYYASGDPLQVVSGYSSPAAASLRANIVNGVPMTVPYSGGVDVQNGTQYLNPAAFTDPVHGGDNDFALALGNAPRYLSTVRGPSH